MAAPMEEKRANEIGRSRAAVCRGAGERTRNHPQSTRVVMMAILEIMSALWTRLPARTPRQLTMVKSAIASADNASHHQHGGVKWSQLPRQFGLREMERERCLGFGGHSYQTKMKRGW